VKRKMKTNEKPNEKKARTSTTRSTGGVGYNFEDQTAAWLLTKMLRGEPAPGVKVAGQQLQMQTHALGWDLDNLLVTGATTPSGEGPHVAVSCKSNVQVTSSGLPDDFVSAAWTQWRKSGPMRRGSDCLSFVTRGRNASFDTVWSDIKTWCADSDAAFAVAKINATEKHKKIFASVKGPGTRIDASVRDEDAVALIRHLQVIPLDFQLVPSETEQDGITRCREILRSGTLEDAGKLWQVLVRTAENARLRGGTIRLPDLWADLRKEFVLRDHPDFSPSWKTLAGVTTDYRNGIETSLPNGFQIARIKDINDLSKLITAQVTGAKVWAPRFFRRAGYDV
jgi:hypothetical protein